MTNLRNNSVDVPARSLFVTGTDTGVGKTRIARLILEALRARGLRAFGFKPVACGDRADAEALRAASTDGESTPLDAINPVHFPEALAPIAVDAGAPDRCRIIDGFEALASQADWVIVEGAGGWEMPLTPEWSMADLAADLAAPVLLVAANRLGVLNHAKLTILAIRRRGLPISGIVLNDTEARAPSGLDRVRETNLESIRRMVPDLPVWSLAFEAPALPPETIDGLISGSGYRSS